MTTLRQILDQTLELLEYNGQFKSFGDLQKHKYQMSKPDEDKETWFWDTCHPNCRKCLEKGNKDDAKSLFFIILKGQITK